ncbi:pilin [Stenotrophomonas sp.]|uniref:pilin n=1 Tax=Stenotrophomonas sp. TaxID=69392 RepID=UPI002899D8F2|nr:pilin [Stenotrophomonas sp.]
MLPPRVSPWVAFVVAAAWIAIYAVLLAAPAEGAQAARRQLHSAVASLTTAIRVVEDSYADNDLQANDRHLGLPASAAFCAHLRLQLPDTGHARLTCQLRDAGRVRGTLVLQRSPQGAWRCEADVHDPQLLPAACAPHAFK